MDATARGRCLLLLRTGVDLDGDEVADLDADRLAYLGVSLSGIMGPEPLALSGAFDAAVLVVPGGRVTSIIGESELFGSLTCLPRPRGTADGDVDRFFPVLQTFLDPDDATVWGRHVQVERLVGAQSPDVLAGIALDDEVVPNVASWTLMRAMELPLLGAELRPVVGIANVAAPVSANGIDARTAGFLPFDVIQARRSKPRRTTTSATPSKDFTRGSRSSKPTSKTGAA